MASAACQTQPRLCRCKDGDDEDDTDDDDADGDDGDDDDDDDDGDENDCIVRNAVGAGQ